MIFFLLFVKFPEIKVPPPSGKSQKISLNLSNFVPPPAAKPVVTPPKPKQPPVPKPMPKPVLKPVSKQPPVVKPLEKPIEKAVEKVQEPAPVVKRKLADDESRTFVEKVSKEENNVTESKTEKPVKLAKKETKKSEKKVEKTAKKKQVAKKRKVTKKRVVKQQPKRKRSKNPLANALMGSGTAMYPTRQAPASSGDYSSRMINQLYGREFDTFTPAQKKFIKHNLGIIHRITQRTLTRNGYPEVAVRTRQQGTNVVSFYLHPNGDISKLRLKTKIGYAALDNNTLEVIRIAYKDYPLPNKKTKIVFYVQYSLY